MFIVWIVNNYKIGWLWDKSERLDLAGMLDRVRYHVMNGYSRPLRITLE